MVPKMNQLMIIITHLVKWSVSLNKLFFSMFPNPNHIRNRNSLYMIRKKSIFFLTQVYVNYATNCKNRAWRNLFYLNTVCAFNTRKLVVWCCSNHVLSRIKYLGGLVRITRSALQSQNKIIFRSKSLPQIFLRYNFLQSVRHFCLLILLKG